MASRSLAGPLGLLALGSLLSELVTSAVHITWTMPSGLTWLFIAACAVAAWVIGYGLGYRRGVNDAINESTGRPDHDLDGD